MALTPEQNEILQALAAAVKASAGGGLGAGVREPVAGGRRGRSTEEREAEAEKKRFESGLKDLSKADKAIRNLNKSFDDMKGSFRYAKDLKTLPANLRKSMEESNIQAVQKMAATVNSLEDVFKIEDQLAANQRLINTLNKYKDKTVATGEQFDEIAEAAKEAGVPISRLIDPTTKTVKNFSNLQEETDALADAMDDAARKTTRMTRAVAAATEAYNKHKQALKDSFNAFVEENRIMRERAANDSKYSDALIGLGISMKDWTNILADNRATQQAMATGGRDFTAEIKSGATQMRKFSYDNVQAAKTTAQMMKGISGFGVSQKNLGGALDEQIKMYKENFRVFDMTAEAFAQYTEQLVADADIRTNLTLMAEKERKSFILSIQARESERLEMGYTMEQARELTKTFAKLAGETPKERMKKAAKQRAMMGALGMSAEGAELQQLMMNINTMQGKERADALKRIEEIQRGAANQLAERKREGLAAEMFFSQIAEKTGFADTAKNLETLTMTGKVRDKAAATRDMADREVPYLISSGLDLLGYINAFQATSIGLLGGILIALTKGKLLTTMGNALKNLRADFGKSFGGPKGGIGAKAGGMTGKIVGKIAAPIAGLVAGWSKYEEVKEKAELTARQKVVQVGATGVGGMGGAMGGAMAGAAIGSVVPVVGTLLGGLIGGALGAWGGSEVGEIVGEGVSGLMDSPEAQAAVGKKVAKAAEETPAANYQTEAARAMSEGRAPEMTPAEWQNQLITTLRELQSYLKVVNEQNMELARVGGKQANAVIEGIRFNSFKGATTA